MPIDNHIYFQLCSVLSRVLSAETNTIFNGKEGANNCRKMDDSMDAILKAYSDDFYVNESMEKFVSAVFLAKVYFPIDKEIKRHDFHSAGRILQ